MNPRRSKYPTSSNGTAERPAVELERYSHRRIPISSPNGNCIKRCWPCPPTTNTALVRKLVFDTSMLLLAGLFPLGKPRIRSIRPAKSHPPTQPFGELKAQALLSPSRCVGMFPTVCRTRHPRPTLNLPAWGRGRSPFHNSGSQMSPSNNEMGLRPSASRHGSVQFSSPPGSFLSLLPAPSLLLPPSSAAHSFRTLFKGKITFHMPPLVTP